MSKRNRNVSGQQVARRDGQASGPTVTNVAVTNYSGPLPHPTVLKEYEDVLPGSAERIMKAFETEALHRRGIENAQAETAGVAIRHELSDRRTGLWLGFLVSLAAMALAAYAIAKGQPAAAAAIGIGDVAALAAVFVVGRRIQAKRETDAPQLPPPAESKTNVPT